MDKTKTENIVEEEQSRVTFLNFFYFLILTIFNFTCDDDDLFDNSYKSFFVLKQMLDIFNFENT